MGFRSFQNTYYDEHSRGISQPLAVFFVLYLRYFSRFLRSLLSLIPHAIAAPFNEGSQRMSHRAFCLWGRKNLLLSYLIEDGLCDMSTHDGVQREVLNELVMSRMISS